MSDSGEKSRFVLVESLYDFHKDGHAWKQKEGATLSVWDVVKESGTRPSRQGGVLSSTQQMLGNRLTMVAPMLSNRRDKGEKEFLIDEITKASRSASSGQLSLSRMDGLFASLLALRTLFTGADDERFRTDLVTATQETRTAMEMAITRDLAKVQAMLADFLSRPLPDVSRFDWCPHAQPPRVIPGPDHLLSTPRFLVWSRRQLAEVHAALKALDVPSLENLRLGVMRDCFEHHASQHLATRHWRLFEELKTLVKPARERYLALSHKFLMMRLNELKHRLASVPLIFMAFGAHQIAVQEWAQQFTALLTPLFSIKADEEPPLPFKLPQIKDSEEHVLVNTRQDYDKLNAMFWTAMEEVQVIKANLPRIQWPIAVPNLMFPSESGTHSSVVVEEAGYKAVMGLYCDHYNVVSALHHAWTESAAGLAALHEMLFPPPGSSMAASFAHAGSSTGAVLPSYLMHTISSEHHVAAEIQSLLGRNKPHTLADHLNDAKGFASLRAFLVGERCPESVDFLQFVRTLASLPANRLGDVSDAIYKRFIFSSGPQTINISDQTKKVISEAITTRTFSPGLFDRAVEEVKSNLNVLYPRYLRSVQFRDYLKDAYSAGRPSPAEASVASHSTALAPVRSQPSPAPSPHTLSSRGDQRTAHSDHAVPARSAHQPQSQPSASTANALTAESRDRQSHWVSRPSTVVPSGSQTGASPRLGSRPRLAKLSMMNLTVSPFADDPEPPHQLQQAMRMPLHTSTHIMSENDGVFPDANMPSLPELPPGHHNKISDDHYYEEYDDREVARVVDGGCYDDQYKEFGVEEDVEHTLYDQGAYEEYADPGDYVPHEGEAQYAEYADDHNYYEEQGEAGVYEEHNDGEWVEEYHLGENYGQEDYFDEET